MEAPTIRCNSSQPLSNVMASVKLIPKPKEPLILPKTGSDRMNGAIIKGYEEDVGKRTSAYVHTAHSITKSRNLLRKYGYTSVPTDEGIKYVLIPQKMKDFYC